VPAGNHGSCIHQNKYAIEDDQYNYHDSLLARLKKGIWNGYYGMQYNAIQHIYLIMKFPYDMRSDWLKQRALSENRCTAS